MRYPRCSYHYGSHVLCCCVHTTGFSTVRYQSRHVACLLHDPRSNGDDPEELHENLHQCVSGCTYDRSINRNVDLHNLLFSSRGVFAADIAMEPAGTLNARCCQARL